MVTTAKVPTKNEQYTDILKELLDEVKAVQKENAARDEWKTSSLLAEVAV